MKNVALARVGALVLGLLVVPACDDAKKEAKPESADKAADGAKKADGDAKEADAEAQPEADAKGDAAEPAAADGAEVAAEPDAPSELPEIGVPECDDYVKEMSACFAGAGVPEEIRGAQKEGFEQTVKGWSDAMKANPDSKGSIATGCKAALDMAKRSYPKCFGA